MKRNISPLLILLLSLVLVGCSSSASELNGEIYSSSIAEPVAEFEEGNRISGTWKATYNNTSLILAIHNNGSYEFYQRKNGVSNLVSGTYTDANDTLTLTPEETKQTGKEEFDFDDIIHIPYTLDGNDLNTLLNNQHVIFTRDIDSDE